MEFLFDLLPLLVIYALARAFTRKRKPTPPAETLSADADAPAARTGFEQLLEALAAAQAEAERSAGLAPAEPADVVDEPVRAEPPTRPPREKKMSVPLQPAATVSRGRPTATAERYYDDQTVFDRVLPQRAPDAHAGIDAEGFSTANFVEHGLQSHAPLNTPAGPASRPLSGIAARLRNPTTAREAFEIQMLLERRGGDTTGRRPPGVSRPRPTR